MVGAVIGGVGSSRQWVTNASAAVVLIGLAAGWYFGRDPLRRYVSAISARAGEVRFNWPLAASSDAQRAKSMQTWLPAAVQRDLARIAAVEIQVDPFAQESLERARQALLATGWFARIQSVRRTPNGSVDITADWRLPAAVVKHQKLEYLVAVGSEVLRLPPRTPVMKGTMPLITNPKLGPKGDALGVLYGSAWPGGDVQAAIDLLRNLRSIPEIKRISGIDLANYIETGHLTIVTDTGAKIVWGSALSELGPGQVPQETRRARLRDILQTRYDESQRLIEIYPPVVMVDKTAAAN